MPAENDQQTLLLVEWVEQMRSRFYGKYRGIVTDVDDPENLGRIKAQVPAVFDVGDSPWAMPATPFAGSGHGLVLLPEVNDGVWIEFEAGDPAHPIWTGCWWARGERPSPEGNQIRLFATTAGHQLVLDDENNEVKLLHAGGAELAMTNSDIVLKLGTQQIKITQSEINLNNGMVKVTTAGASLVNDALKVGA